MFSTNLSKARRGKKNKQGVKTRISNLFKVITLQTELKISVRCKGVSVKGFDKFNNLVNQFSTMTSATKSLGVNTKTINMIYKRSKSYNNFIYKFNKDNRVWIYDSNNKYVQVLDSAKKNKWSI